MREFIHYENVRHYLRLLDQTTDLSERGRILKLMAEELVKEFELQRDMKVVIPDEDGRHGPVH